MTRLLRRKVRPAQHPLETYLREINDTPLLNAEEERRLAYRIIDEGDTEARDHMVRANLRLVVNIARRYGATGLGLQDLIEEGNLGLMRAVEAFDPSMNTRFSTYASYWIKQSIKRAIINAGKTIRVPAYTVELLNKWRRAAALLQEELGRTPEPVEIAAKLKLSKRKFHIVLKALSVGNVGAQENEERSLDDAVADGRTDAPDAALARNDDLRQVLGLLDKMDPREAAVLRLRFGLDGEDSMTLAQIGDRLGLTRERVRQIERDALEKLREGLEAA
jgi:RNA polymerase primary sigma factor